MFTLKQALEAIEGRQEFVTKELEHTLAFDYVIIKDDSFSDPKFGWIRRNFRGITFCKVTGNLLSLPFPKFFNINQNTESQFILHKNKKATIYEKADGSLIHFYRKMNGELVASTCRSPESLQAKEALDFVNKNQRLLYYILDSIDNGLTPIFEWCAPHNQIVVHYKNARLIYLMSRFRDNGNYLFEEKYEDRVTKFDLSFSEVLNNTNKTEFEGYVCYLEDGNVFKIKTPWYLERHKSVDLLTRPRYKSYEISLDGYMDDVIALSPEGHQTIFREIDNEVKNDILETRLALEKEFEELNAQLNNDCMEDYRKRFALAAKESANFPALMQLLSGKSPDGLIKKKLLGRYIEKYPGRIMQ
jgi:RNA ligase